MTRVLLLVSYYV